MWQDPRLWFLVLSAAFSAGVAWAFHRAQINRQAEELKRLEERCEERVEALEAEYRRDLERMESKLGRAFDRIDELKNADSRAEIRAAAEEQRLAGKLDMINARVEHVAKAGHDGRNEMGARMGRMEMVIFEGFTPAEVIKRRSRDGDDG